MKAGSDQITRDFVDQQIEAAERDARARRERLSDAERQTNAADERLQVLRLAREILFRGDEDGATKLTNGR